MRYAEFDREGDTLADAILSAIADAESVPGIRVLRIEPDDFVTAAEIAERLGRSRESVRLLANGNAAPATSPRLPRIFALAPGSGVGATSQPGRTALHNRTPRPPPR